MTTLIQVRQLTEANRRPVLEVVRNDPDAAYQPVVYVIVEDDRGRQIFSVIKYWQMRDWSTNPPGPVFWASHLEEERQPIYACMGHITAMFRDLLPSPTA